MLLFEYTKALFEQPWKWAKFTNLDKKKHYFIVSRFMAIMYPLQALPLNHTKINMAVAMDFWQGFMRARYNKVPFWMWIKGSVKKKEENAVKAKVTDKQVEGFAKAFGYEARSVKESLNFYPEDMVKEIRQWEKTRK